MFFLHPWQDTAAMGCRLGVGGEAGLGQSQELQPSLSGRRKGLIPEWRGVAPKTPIFKVRETSPLKQGLTTRDRFCCSPDEVGH